MSTLILFNVVVELKPFQRKPKKDGKANLKISGCNHHVEMQWVSMEKQLSGKLFQDFQH